ncbi:MAG: flippase [Chloroflexi bacterium]|nr:flippase [Chloroflexota bacterium]
MATLSVEGGPASEAGDARSDEIHDRGSVGQSVTRGALAMLTTQPLTWGVSLFAAIATPRLLGADTLGQVTVAVTICNIASTFACFGVSEYLVRRVAQSPQTRGRDAGVALAVQLMSSLPAFLIVAILGSRYATSIVEPSLLLVALLPMLLNPSRTVLLSLFRGLERHAEYAWLNAVSSVISTLGMLAILFLGWGAVPSLVVGLSLVAAVTIVAWIRSGIRPEFPSVRRMTVTEFGDAIRAGVPFMGWQLTQMAYSQIDRLLLGVMAPAAQVGWYAAANRIVSFPIFIPTLIVTPLFPALSRSVREPTVLRRTVAQTLKVTLLLTVPLSAGIMATAPAIPALLGWPEDFLDATAPMAILALQLPLVAMGMVLGSVLMAVGRERRLVVVAVVATGVNVGLNALAIPLFERLTGNGGIGAAVVTVISELVMLIGAAVLLPKYVLDPRSLVDAFRIGVAGMATAIVAALVLPVGLAVSIPAGAVAYLAAIKLLRVVKTEDVNMVARTPFGSRLAPLLARVAP